jgi:hypothetical protein
MEVVIKNELLWKLIGKGNSYEVVRHENEIVIFELSLECFDHVEE